jgi:DNA invertase Pin-like site-specific DNA recombinase
MEDKLTAILMVRQDELKPEDGGSYDAPLARQKAACLEYLKQKSGSSEAENVQIYTNRKDLFLDIERHRVARLVVENVDRLGSTKDETEAILLELKMGGVELVTPGK